MIRGWRNNPAWVEFYKRRDEERHERQMQALVLEHQMQSLQYKIARETERLLARKPKGLEAADA